VARKNYITIDDKKMRRKMQAYQRIVPKEITQLVRNGSRLLCVELAGFTFPTKKDHGESRIGKDVSKIFTALNPEWWKKHLEKGFLRKAGADGFLTEPGQIVAMDLAAAKSFHTANRVFSKGRELSLNKKAAVQTKDRNRLVKELQKKVGLCKAGWAVAASQCRADVRQPMRGIPQWVTRNMGKAVAAVKENRMTGMSFRIDLTNRINYTDKLLSNKYRTIAQAIARGKFYKMMSKAIRSTKVKEAGFK